MVTDLAWLCRKALDDNAARNMRRNKADRKDAERGTMTWVCRRGLKWTGWAFWSGRTGLCQARFIKTSRSALTKCAGATRARHPGATHECARRGPPPAAAGCNESERPLLTTHT